MPPEREREREKERRRAHLHSGEVYEVLCVHEVYALYCGEENFADYVEIFYAACLFRNI